ncbi:MAG TPA: L-threonylcarbamoyladenylate synthase [Planctomycetota bacterium]|nr:L-threonylcarbamoyladenylate synthase [Planctomycetota bacterium]
MTHRALDPNLKAEIQTAAQILRAGGVVAFPTETVYGLGADAANPAAVAKVFALKGRPATHPLIVHIADAAALAHWCRAVPPAAEKLAAAFWPGPLTLILQRAPGVIDAVTGGQDTVGLRVPAHPVARALLTAFGGGIAAPSANKFGRVSPTTAAHVKAEFAEGAGPEQILDGGPCMVGVESTIVDLSGLPSRAPTLLRPGGVTKEQLEAVLGAPILVVGVPAPDAVTPGVDSLNTALPRVPGTLESHYAPLADVYPVTAAELPMRIAALQKEGIRFVVMARRAEIQNAEACQGGTNDRRGGGEGCGPGQAGIPCNTLYLALPDDDAEYARRLYQLLRDADAQGFEAIVIVPPVAAGLGLAIVDRLRRAAGGSR